MYCTVLYCTVLYCTVLYCTVLYCTVLYCIKDVYCYCGISGTWYRAMVQCVRCAQWYHERCLAPRPRNMPILQVEEIFYNYQLIFYLVYSKITDNFTILQKKTRFLMDLNVKFSRTTICNYQLSR